MVIGKAGGLLSLLPPNEDGHGSTSRGLEKGLERVQFVPFHLEAVSLELLSHPGQPIRLLPFSVDAAPVHEEEDPGGQTKVSKVKQ